MYNIEYQIKFTKEDILKEFKQKFENSKTIMEVLNTLGTDAISIHESSSEFYFADLFCDYTCKTSHLSDESYYVIHDQYKLNGRFISCYSDKKDPMGEKLITGFYKPGEARMANKNEMGSLVKEVKKAAKEKAYRDYDKGIQEFRVNEWIWDNPGDNFNYTYWNVVLRVSLKDEKRVTLAAVIYPTAPMDDADQRMDIDEKGVLAHEGCYVATCVYGSYDCPQVWTLRRYRDYKLGTTWHGRLFIKLYYAISPTIVKLFGDKNWFKRMWKGKLDRMVDKYKKQGFEDTPYDDRKW